jgi:hypothetical protein
MTAAIRHLAHWLAFQIGSETISEPARPACITIFSSPHAG